MSDLRFGEVAALQRSDLDMERRVIKVTKNFDKINNIITPPKTRTSIREVYMPEELYLKLPERLFHAGITQQDNAPYIPSYPCLTYVGKRNEY